MKPISKVKRKTLKAPVKTEKATLPRRGGLDEDGERWRLRLYVAGQTPRSLTAFTNLKKLCEEHLKGKYQIEVIDLLKNPALAEGDQIVALPTLVRKLPQPIRRVIGDLSNMERVMVGMDLKPVISSHAGTP